MYCSEGLTYTSNALEGNSLTESETKVVIEDGLTIGGKPLRDVYPVRKGCCLHRRNCQA